MTGIQRIMCDLPDGQKLRDELASGRRAEEAEGETGETMEPRDSLQQKFDDWWSVPDFAVDWSQQDIDLLKEMAWQSYQCGHFEDTK